MAVKIKLKRLGKKRQPQYRIIVADARAKRDGRAIEEIGQYHPKEDPSFIEVNSERVQYWLGVGAQPTEPVAAILRVTGDWQKFKGLPGSEGTLRVAEPKVSKKVAYEAAAKESLDEGTQGAATTPKKKASKPKAEAPAEAPKVTEVAETSEPKPATEAPTEAAAETPEAPVEATAEVAAEATESAETPEAPEAPAEATDEKA